MSPPSAQALAAQDEILHTIPDEYSGPFWIAQIIDRHMAQKTEKLPRFFRCESYSYEWDGRVMWYLDPRTVSIFVSPQELMDCADAYETDEHGNRL